MCSVPFVCMLLYVNRIWHTDTAISLLFRWMWMCVPVSRLFLHSDRFLTMHEYPYSRNWLFSHNNLICCRVSIVRWPALSTRHWLTFFQPTCLSYFKYPGMTEAAQTNAAAALRSYNLQPRLGEREYSPCIYKSTDMSVATVRDSRTMTNQNISLGPSPTQSEFYFTKMHVEFANAVLTLWVVSDCMVTNNRSNTISVVRWWNHAFCAVRTTKIGKFANSKWIFVK